jgi:hypothetical protein
MAARPAPQPSEGRPGPSRSPTPPPAEIATQVSRFGLMSAATIVDRYVIAARRALDGTARPGMPSSAAAGSPSRLAELAGSAAAPILDTYLDLVDWFSSIDPETASAVELPPASTGSSSLGTVWVHNDTTTSVGPLRVVVSDFIEAGGGHIDATVVVLTPRQLDSLAAHSAAQVDVEVRVARDQPSGTYHGLLLVSGSDQPLPLRLQVGSA